MDIKSNSVIFWFRNDLRISDNQALTQAKEYADKHQLPLHAIYLATPAQWQQHDQAPIQLDFIERQLNQLSQSLAQLGIPLSMFNVNDFQAQMDWLITQQQDGHIKQVFAGLEPEWNERQRDQTLLDSGFPITFTDEHCLLPPMSVKNQHGMMYKVFTPFKNRWREIMQSVPVEPLGKLTAFAAPTQAQPITLNCDKTSSQQWPTGEKAAHQLLRQFCKQNLADYGEQRDYPALHVTSQLSPYLAIGILSPRQCLAALLAEFPNAIVEKTPAEMWLNELIWREFYRHLLVAFPKLSRNQNFNALANNIQWQNNPTDFQKWCDGRTGYPIVDAAMRQLNTTGWMHNRLRMIVASFLTKHLLIDWRWGEQYFRQKLIDGDLAANNGGWQWSAGTGCDAQPYFRIFNPIEQSKKFDPDGKFIKDFVPELADVNAKQLHQANTFTEKGYLISEQYPLSIIEHKAARERAMATLSVMKKQNTS
ncbi:deoxyribodipyrimidine photo-lyase [Parashewanella curva]|uniref:Deoxyribodipyrimidine photo-lyase n=1 Tax=Parashewanella curva TaxID=2338552 RepID=A0A3L8Q3A8_9GAMM|nr:deoxyribodipyrimidine photo-lyase [Parashewanella curva]RLV61658.1 deoxyribodipyrimidine photo-lyase [Parashewanella curva]